MITVNRTFDTELIKSCMLCDEIYKTVSQDCMTKEKYEPDLLRTCWLSLDDNGEFMGMVSFDVQNSACIEIHIGIFKKFRGKQALEATKLALIWLSTNFSCYKKVIAFIPVIYKNVKVFAMQCGFKLEGLNRESYIKNGVVVDQWLLGITQKEIGGL